MEMLLTLRFPTTEPVKMHVHGFNTLVDNSFVRGTGNSGVVGLDGWLWLGPIHFSDGVLQWNHCLGGDEKSTKF